ncbi:carbohydrate kinase family protein [Reinekea blandensis]|uniref:Sugar kinase, ribokinase family protein n=1 Tax=Reinekea blandensis MED297 TaxID=314283 RepID=A4BHV5_9GAMM|nr:carbohydrate kinase [Reinekea blandensis]EAR08360.1 Sugar kinase, ribokinase family protein [Reinekea sp. MED297] [Reinekea blandensis MED297]
MGAITCFGEALIDFLNTGHRQEGLINIPDFRQFPGGAPANVAVAIARLGGDARFAGQVGDDTFGQFLAQSLETYGVDTQHLSLHPTAKTALAFVFLDDDGERSFEFHRDATADLLLTEFDVKDRWFIGSDIFHFCSNTLTDANITKTTLAALKNARKQGCITSFDINLRHNLWPDGQADRDRVLACFEHVDLIKVSREELDYLSPDGEVAFVRHAIEQGVTTVLITDGGQPIRVLAKGVNSEITPPATTVVDTTAAGDAFTGGFLFALAEQPDLSKALTDQKTLEEMALFASKCGAYTVARQGAFTSLPTLDALESND